MSDDDSLSLPRKLGPYALTEEGVQWNAHEMLRWRDISRFSIVGDILKGRGVALHETAFEGGFGVPDAKALKPRAVLYVRGTGQTPEGLMLQMERLREQYGATKSAAAKKRPSAPAPKTEIQLPPRPETPPVSLKREPKPQAKKEPKPRPPLIEKREPGPPSNANKYTVTQVSRSYSSTSVNVRNGRITEMVEVKVDSPQETFVQPAPEEKSEEAADVNMAVPFLLVGAVALVGAVFFENYKKDLLTFLCMAIFMWMIISAYRQYRHWTKNIPFRAKMLIFFAVGAIWSIVWNALGHPWVARPAVFLMFLCGPLFLIAALFVPPRR